MNTLKIITVIILAVGLVLGVGCEKSTDPGPAPTPTPAPNPTPDPDPDPDPGDAVDSRLVGEWIFTGATVNGQTADLADVLGWEATSAMAAFSIDAGGEYIYIEVDVDIELTYYTEGTVSTSGSNFKITTPDITYSGTWSLSRSVLSLSTVIDSDKVVLKAETLSSPSAVSGLLR